MEKSEDSFVAWLASRYRTRDGSVLIGIGDDMAMLQATEGGAKAGGRVLVTSDMLMDGVHFDTALHLPEQIGRKALAASLSDCAAMAVRPCHAVVSVALPASWSMRQAQELFLGMEVLAKAYGCAIVGGDTNSWSRPLVVDVFVMAKPWKDVEPVRRKGMRPGDVICVTGRLGGSLYRAASDRPGVLAHHLSFEPRVREAHWLAERLGTRLHAMLDLSDGLSTDARRLAAASACGIEFDAVALDGVVSEAAVAASREDGRSPLDHLLNDGEDFELLLAVDPAALTALEDVAGEQGSVDARPPDEWRAVGTAVEASGIWLRQSDGRRKPVQPGGWQHFTE